VAQVARVPAVAVAVVARVPAVAVAVVAHAQAAVVAGAAAAAADGVDKERTNMNTQEHSLRRVRLIIRLALLAGAIGLAPAALAQKAYPTAEAATDAFVDSIARHDGDALKAVIGPDYKKYVPHANAEDVTNFLEAWAKAHRIVPAGDAKAYLEVGKNGWTMPIPLVKTAAGWSFDTRATPEELRVRRIGRNELSAIQVALAYTDAQEDYSKFDRDRNGRKDYAQRLLSTKGKHDGLYWPSKPGEPESPLGSLVANVKPGEGYHGYRYRILTAQGKDAPGGAKNYVVNGDMTGGYALVAWPIKWGDTAVMTFIVSKDRVVYEKDLGPTTDALARAMTTFNPDSTWAKVPPK
jgi:hypothetical protein